MVQPKYVAVTACKNEEKYIERCLNSVLDQTIPPAAYVVVDDGSTDRTSTILETYGSRIVVLRREPGTARERGEHHLNLLLISSEEGFRRAPDWKYLLTVDADEILSNNYVERLLTEMEQDPRLGITSGIPISRIDGGYRRIYRASHNVWNGARIYRRECWNDFGPIPSVRGWDFWVQIEANRLRWRTRPFDDINFLEERPWGDQSITDWVKRGVSRKRLGYAPLSHIITCVTRITKKPYFIGSLAFFLSFLLYSMEQTKYFSKEYYDFASKYTLNFIRKWVTISKIKNQFRKYR